MVEMKILNSHEDWLNARSSAIGGSDASAVLGMNPWKSNLELWMEKTGQLIPEDISEKPIIQYGHQAEPLLREMFKIDFPQYEVQYQENNIWINPEKPFAHASLDGWLIEKETGRKGILEIKTTNILRSMDKEKWRGRIPDNYYLQVIHYMMVTGFDFAILKAHMKHDYGGVDGIHFLTNHYLINREDVEPDIQYLEKAERDFWKSVVDKKKPGLILPDLCR